MAEVGGERLETEEGRGVAESENGKSPVKPAEEAQAE